MVKYIAKVVTLIIWIFYTKRLKIQIKKCRCYRILYVS